MHWRSATAVLLLLLAAAWASEEDLSLNGTSTSSAAPSSSSSTEAPASEHQQKPQQSYPSLLQSVVGRALSSGGGGGPPGSPFAGRLFDFPNPAPGSNLFNTSLAFTVPLFSINTNALTGQTGRSFMDGLGMNDVPGMGGYSAMSGGGGFPPLGSGVVAGLAIPALVAGILILLFDIFSRPFLASLTPPTGRASDSLFSGGFGGIAEYLLTFVENSLDHVPTIDGEECIKRSVCEAHSNPKKYGIIALPLQLLFPPYPYSGTDDTSKVSKYQLAARYGKNENANCGAQYHGCVINPLDLITSFARMITDI